MEKEEILFEYESTDAADDLCDALGDLIDTARTHGTDWPIAHVVPCVPGVPIAAGAQITGIGLARVDGVICINLFAEGAA